MDRVLGELSAEDAITLDSRRWYIYLYQRRLFSLWPKSQSPSAIPELVKLGARQIVGFNDGTPEADACKIRYPFCRNTLLRGHAWLFDRIYTLAAPLAAPASLPPSWAYAYNIPSDCSRLVSVTVDDQEVDYEIIGSLFYTNHAAVGLRYTQNFSAIDDGRAWPDDFAEALAIFLAMDLSMLLTQNPGIKQTLERELQNALAMARFNGAVERAGPEIIETSTWLTSRDGGFTDIGARNINGNEPL